MADGVVKRYENGKLDNEIPFSNGKVEGIKKRYYESGEVQIKIPYKNGKLEGAIEIYHKNGKLAFTLLDNNLKCANGKTLAADEGIVSILHKLNEGYDISFYKYIDKSFNEYINFCEN